MQGIYLEKLVLLTQKIGSLDEAERSALILEHLLKLSIREIRRLQISNDTRLLKVKRETLHSLEKDLIYQVYAYKMKTRSFGHTSEDMEIRWTCQKAYDKLACFILNVAGLDYTNSQA